VSSGLPCASIVVLTMRKLDMSNKHEVRTRIIECVSSKGMLPAFSIAYNEIQKYKSNAREWQRLEDMIMQELASYDINPHNELEQFLYLIAYTLLPRMDEILAITHLEPSEWDIDMFLMKPSLDTLVSEAVNETFQRLEQILDLEILNSANRE